MARRKGNKLLAGLGEGISNLGLMLYRDRTQDRMDKRAAAAQKAVLDRQTTNAENASLMGLVAELAKNPDLDPSALDTMAELLGREAPKGLGEKVSPMRRRLESTVGKPIDAATNLAGVPTDESILGMSAARGATVDPMFTGPMPEGEESYAGAPAEVRELGRRAGARRRSFRQAPGDPFTRITESGSEETFAPSLDDLVGGITTKPSAARQGALKAEEETSLLSGVGPARAKQAGAEATSAAQGRIDVEMSPKAVNARVSEAGRTSGVKKTAEINAEIANAQKIIDFETQKAMAKMQTVATEKEYGEWGKQIADARASASSAMPIIGQLRALWQDAQPDFEAALKANPDFLVQLAQGWAPRSVMTEPIRKYLDLLESARPRLARVMGNVGNFTEGEQQRAGFVVPDALDAANGGRTATDKFDRMEKLFMAAPSIAQRQRPGSKPITAEEMNNLLNKWTPATQGDIDLPPEPFDILITPRGIQRPGGR